MAKKVPAIILPKGFDLDKSYALQRLMDDPQHKDAVDYIVNDICSTYREPTESDPYFTYRNIGRASVGMDIVSIYKMNLSKVREMLEKEKK